jgi:putative gag protein
MKKSDMIDLIIENFAKGNLKLKHCVQSIAEQKRALKAKCESELSLFAKSDDEC